MTLRPWFWLLLVAAGFGGCAEEPGHHKTETRSFEFKGCSLQRLRGDERLYEVRGCPKTILDAWDPPERAAIFVPAESTGLIFNFTIQQVEPRMEAAIVVRNGSSVLLADKISFVAGHPIGRDYFTATDLERHLVWTTVVFSTCEATDIEVSWGPEALLGASLVIQSFNDSNKEYSIARGWATCNNYWG